MAPPFLLHEPKHQDPLSQHPGTRRVAHLPVIPDLRFEHSYLKSIRPHIHTRDEIERTSSTKALKPEEERDTFGGQEHEKVEKEKEQDDHERAQNRPLPPAVVPSYSEVVQIEWQKVFWVTIRDQVISPLLQGALWGVAGHFVIPLLAHVRQAFFSSKLLPSREGLGVGWLRSWVKGLGFGVNVSRQ